MNEEQIKDLSDAIAIKIARYKAPVLTLEEAMAYVGVKSERSFRRWRTKWKVKPCALGRYSRRSLDMAMNKESRAAA